MTGDVQIIKPLRGGQSEFLSRTEFEVLFGGEAGPGKTWALVIDAMGLQYQFSGIKRKAIEIPEYRGVIFRRESGDLSKVLDEAHKYYPMFYGTYTAQRRGEPGPAYTFPEFRYDDKKKLYAPTKKEGAKIFFCHLQHEDDKYSHTGIEYQYSGWDEITLFTLTQYLYVFSRMRSKVDGLFTRVRSTTNPVGEGLWWVKDRVISKGMPGKTRYFIADKEPEKNPRGIEVPAGTRYAKSRVFIPGDLDENIYVNKEEYRGNVMQMGVQYERALLKGDWDAFGGTFFADFDKGRMVVKPFEVPKTWELVGALDPGWSSPCSFSLKARDPKGNIYRLVTYYEPELSAQRHAKNIRQLIDEFKFTDGRMPSTIVSGTDAFAKQDKYAIVSHDVTFADIFAGEGMVLQPAFTDRIVGWGNMKGLMKDSHYFVFDIFNEPFLTELTTVVSDEKRPEDIKGRGNDPNVKDHALDEDRYATAALHKPAKKTTTDDWVTQWLGRAQAIEGGWKPGG